MHILDVIEKLQLEIIARSITCVGGAMKKLFLMGIEEKDIENVSIATCALSMGLDYVESIKDGLQRVLFVGMKDILKVHTLYLKLQVLLKRIGI